MKEQYPLWLILHLFLDFLAQNGNKDMPIREYFELCHAFHLLPTIFRNSFSLRRIADSISLQASHTDTPWKIVDNCLPLWFRCHFFGARVPDIIIKLNNNKKVPVGTNFWIKFYIRKWTVDNVRINTMVTPCQKTRDMFVFSIQINIKNHAMSGSVLQATCGLLRQNEISTQLYPHAYYHLELSVIANFCSTTPNCHPHC